MHETQEPTLRRGDQAPDGWVEYLQDLLQVHGHNVTRDGDFGANTEHAVIRFQQANHLLADGVVGNQTWACLRGESPVAVGTDGERAHTHRERGIEARWLMERDVVHYDASDDMLRLYAYNVGETTWPASEITAEVRVTGAEFELNGIHLFNVNSPVPPGGMALFEYHGLKDAVPHDAAVQQYTVHATLTGDAGGDQIHAEVTIPGIRTGH
jgi:Putative peptidoglycan binding domain